MPELIWGVSEIAKRIGRCERTTQKLLSEGCVPGAKRVGRGWCFQPDKFDITHFGKAAA